MAIKYSPKIINDGLIAYWDAANNKSINGLNIINRSNFTTNWVTKRSIITNVTGIIEPPPDLPYDTTVYKLMVDFITYANTLHRIQHGSNGAIILGTRGNKTLRYNCWVRGDLNNTVNVTLQNDIGDSNDPDAKGSAIVGNTDTWQKIELIDAGGTYIYDTFCDLSIIGAGLITGDIVYISGLSILQFNTTDASLLEPLITNPGYVLNNSTKNAEISDLVSNNNANINEYGIYDASIYGGVIKFDASIANGYLNLDSSIIIDSSTSWTIETVFIPHENSVVDTQMRLFQGANINSFFKFEYANRILALNDDGNTFTFAASLTPHLIKDVPNHVVLRNIGDGIGELFINNVELNTTLPLSGQISIRKIGISQNITTTSDIGYFKIYNRYLYDDELDTNFIIAKNRYNL